MKKQIAIKKIFVIMILFVLLTWTGTLILYFSIESKKKAAADLAREITLKSDQKDEVKALSKDIHNLTEDLAKIDGYIVGSSQDKVADFLKTIEEISLTSGTELNINSIDISPIENKEFAEMFEDLNLTLQITGDWHEVFLFLSLIEKLPQKIEIRNLGLSALEEPGEITNNIKWAGNLTLITKKFK